jgi:hypothetical protein
VTETLLIGNDKGWIVEEEMWDSFKRERKMNVMERLPRKLHTENKF